MEFLDSSIPATRPATHFIHLRLRLLSDAVVVAATVARYARSRGASRRVAGEVAIIASELATNAVRHAGGGTVSVGSNGHAIEIVCTDRGRGDVATLRARASTDRYATSLPAVVQPGRSLGQGLGAVARLSDGFDFDARVGGGVVARATRVLDR